jgi:hypothetical protein
MTEPTSPPQRSLPPMLFRGFAPLVFLAALVVLLAVLAPSMAPEHYVPRSVVTTSTTGAPAPTSSAPVAPNLPSSVGTR